MLKTQEVEARAARELYLAEVSESLRGRLSPLEAFESIDEMRGHIDAMAAAYGELGLESLDAMNAALQKFGPAKQIGKVFPDSTPRALRRGIPVGIVLTAASEAVLGATLMVLIDAWFVTRHNFSNSAYGLDMAIGSATGAVIGMLAFVWRLKPVTFAAIVCTVLNVFLGLTLYQTYFLIGKGGIVPEIAVSLTLALYALSIAGVRLGRYFKQKFGTHLPTQIHPTTT